MPVYQYEYECSHHEPLPDHTPDNPGHIHVDDSVKRRIDVSKLQCPACQDDTDHGIYSPPGSIWYTKIFRTEYMCGHGFNKLQSERDWEGDVHDTGNESVEEIFFLREGGCGACMKTKGQRQAADGNEEYRGCGKCRMTVRE
ncbi:hypothetical protein MMC30_003444 [Trapelia coarctata]|nr:hypothetical protein [Trapelia coarctata]